MILLFCFFYIFLVIRTSSDCCDTQMGDANLAPGIFFPESNNTNNNSTLPSTSYPSNGQNSTYTTPQQNNAYTTPQQNNAYTTPQQNSQINYAQLQNPTATQSQQVSYQNTGTANTLGCDNTLEREKFRMCVGNAIRSLAVILENCRKTLGEHAKECKINKECLESLLGNKEDNNERYKDDERQVHNFMSKSADGDSLSEFLEFLEKRLERDKPRNDTNYDRYSQKNNYDKYQEDWDRDDDRDINNRYDRQKSGFNDDRSAFNNQNDNYKQDRKEKYERRGFKEPCEQLNRGCDQCSY
ncbi:hypothetical protein BDAP_001063 [Binucleata daphniae]